MLSLNTAKRPILVAGCHQICLKTPIAPLSGWGFDNIHRHVVSKIWSTHGLQILVVLEHTLKGKYKHKLFRFQGLEF